MLAHTAGTGRSWLNGCNLGVDLFFVLSGFLITTLLLEEQRRARRLIPALATLLGTYTVVELAVGRNPIGPVTEGLFYLTNFIVSFVAQGGPLVHLWSLAQEEQFYLVWPLVLLGLLRSRARPTQMLGLLGVVLIALNVHRLLLIANGAQYQRLWFAPDTHADSIVIGCAAAIIRSHRLASTSRLAGRVASAVLVATTLTFRELIFWTYPAVLPLFALGAGVLILASLEHSSAPLRVPVLTGLGKISYSLYLWHYPMIVWLGPIGAVPSMALACLSYRYVEQPFRRRRMNREPTPEIGLAVPHLP